MLKQTNQTIASQLNKLNENETLAVAGYISQLLSKRNSKTKDNYSNDDLIKSLADAYENRRACQVFEWEKIRRQNAHRGA
jgi:hypothetical protein